MPSPQPSSLPTPSVMPRLYEAFLGHALGCVALAEETAAGLEGSEQAAALQEMDMDYECLLAALRWLRGQRDGGALGCRLALALCDFWEIRGLWAEGRHWLEVMAEKEVPDKSLVAQALNWAGIFARMQSDWDSAFQFFQRAYAIHLKRDDLKGQGIALNGLGAIALIRGEQAAARKFFEETVAIQYKRDDPVNIARGLGNLALVYFDEGDYAAAQKRQEEALAIQRTLGGQQQIADALSNLGNTHFVQDHYEEAKLCYQESLDLKRAIGYLPGLGDGYGNLACLSAKLGEYAAAYESLRESLRINEKVGDMENFACDFETFADLAAQRGLPEQTVLWHAVAAVLRQKHDTPLRPADAEKIQVALAAARTLLGERAYKAAWKRGQTLSLERAIAQALKIATLAV